MFYFEPSIYISAVMDEISTRNM